MLKTAYEIGFQQAIEDSGIEKEAFWQAGLSKLVGLGGKAGQAGQWAMRNPLAAKTVAGAGIGGAAGAIGGDEGGFMRGALGGAALGAGAHAGRLVGLGRSGRMARNIGRTGRTASGTPALPWTQGMAKSELARRAPRAAMGAGLGAVGAGALGYGMSRSMVPGAGGEPPPWYRRF